MTGHPLHTDWSLAGTAERRTRYYAASQQKFVPFKDPLVFTKGSMQYLWDSEGRKYTDLLGMNVCVSVGHAHPTVVKAAMEQAQAGLLWFKDGSRPVTAQEVAAALNDMRHLTEGGIAVSGLGG